MATDYRQKALTEMQKYIGTAEPKGDDKFITAYNKWAGTSFGVDSTPWCAIYATYIARTVGVPTTIIPTFASCSAAVDWFKRVLVGVSVGHIYLRAPTLSFSIGMVTARSIMSAM